MVQFTSCIQEVTYVGLVGVKPFLYFGHILLRLWMVGWRFYAVFAFEKWSNMSFVKSAFFLTYFILGPFTRVLNDLRFPLISKENIPFMDQVDHIIHFWFLKQITLEYCKKHTPTYTTEIMPFREIFSIYNPPFTNFLCNFMCTKVRQETWFMND